MWEYEWILILIMNAKSFSVMITILISISYANAKGERSESQETAADQLTKLVFSKPSTTIKNILTSLFSRHTKPVISSSHAKSPENTLLRNLASKILVTSLGYKRSKTSRIKKTPEHQAIKPRQRQNQNPSSTTFHPAKNHSSAELKEITKKKDGKNKSNTVPNIRHAATLGNNNAAIHPNNNSDSARVSHHRRMREMRYMGSLVNRLNRFYANISHMKTTTTKTKDVVHVPFRRREVRKLQQLFASLVKQEADLHSHNKSTLGAMSRSKLRSFSNLLSQLGTLPNGTARQVQFDLIDSHNTTRKDFVVMDDMMDGAPRSNADMYPGDPINDNVGNHLSDIDERSCYDCTVPTDSYVPSSRENDKLAQYILSQDILSVNNKLGGYAKQYQHWNIHDQNDEREEARNDYEAPRGDYGSPRNGNGAPRNEYEGARNNYEASRNSFDTPRHRYGTSRGYYAGSGGSFGEPKYAYRENGLGDNRNQYGLPRNSYGPPRDTYKSSKPAFGSFRSNYGASARHSFRGGGRAIHVIADGRTHDISEYRQNTLDSDRNHAIVDDRNHAVALAEFKDNSLVYNRNNAFFNGHSAVPTDYRNEAAMSMGIHRGNGGPFSVAERQRFHSNRYLPMETRPVDYPEYTGETRQPHTNNGRTHHSNRNNRYRARNPFQEELDIGLNRGVAEDQFEEQGEEDNQLVDKVVNEIFYQNPLSHRGNGMGSFDGDYFGRTAKEDLAKMSRF